MPEPSTEDIDRFIAKWGVSGGHERGAAQHFLLDFCRLFGLDEPDVRDKSYPAAYFVSRQNHP